MGKGREIGLQLREWLDRADRQPLQGRILQGWLLDALGEETRLAGPLRDLAQQPLFRKLLQEPSAALRRSLMEALRQELVGIYAAPTLSELTDLLTAVSGQPVPQSAPAPEAASAYPSPSPPAAVATSAAPSVDPSAARTLQRVSQTLNPLGPGLALGFVTALVLLWLGGELGRLLPPSFNGLPVLLVLLALPQLVLLRPPLRRLRHRAALQLSSSTDPQWVWRWITTPWVHQRQGEAILNGVLLLILLFGTPLPLGQLLLRYLLTSIATLAPVVFLARRWRIHGFRDGATGAVAALIALATGISLLHWRPIHFPFGLLSVPSWVLLLVNATIQMAWVLPRLGLNDRSTPLQRLLCSCWCWGTLMGFTWALITRLQEWFLPLLRRADALIPHFLIGQI